jgi:hypothetical protein
MASIPYGYVYRITNPANGKTYIGLHRPRPGEKWRAYLGSGTAVKNAVAKHEASAMVKTLVSWHCTLEELAKAQEKAIKGEKKAGRGEYNLLAGSPLSSQGLVKVVF